MNPSYDAGYNTHRTESQMSIITELLKSQGGSSSYDSFVILPETAAESPGRQRKISHIEAELLHVRDLCRSEAIRTRFINAIQRGRVGFQTANNQLTFSRKCAEWLSDANIAVTALRRRTSVASEKEEPVKKQEKHVESSHTKEETSQISSSKKVQQEHSQETSAHELDKDVVEVESFTEFGVISDEVYAKFLLQFNKISTTVGKPDKETLAEVSVDMESTENAAVAKAKAKSSFRLTLAKRLLEAGKHHSIAEKRTDQMAKRIIKKEIRFLAGLEKDELAAKKMREFIKTDLTKSEIKSTNINRASNTDGERSKATLDKIVKDDEITEAGMSKMLEINEINEAALNKMLENNEITEAAMHALLTHKNIDEKFLKSLLEKELISENAYRLFKNTYLQ